MSKKKIAVVIGVVVVIAALGGTGFYFRDAIKEMIPFMQEGNSADKVYVEKLSKVMNQYTGISNRYNGVVETQDTYEVNVDSSRTVSEVLVAVGDEVEEGQALVSYDTSDIKLQIQQANLEVESINNDIDSYNKQIETLAAARDKVTDENDKFSYTSQIQALENSIAQKKYDLESKQLEISKYKTQLNNSEIKSKAAGIVKEINEKGMDSNGNTAPFMTILQAGEYRIKGTIDEQNVWMLSDGQNVVIRSRVDETQTWEGTILKVDTENAAQSGNGNNAYSSSSNGSETATKYPFYIELASADGLILGQHVYIEMDEGQEEEKEGLWLYASYVVQDDGEPYVWAANAKEKLEKKYVELGEYDENLDEYQIVSGLTIDDYITWPMPGLYEGVTTVTNMEEVDYSSPLYNQESTETFDDEMMPGEDVFLDETFSTETGMMPGEGMENIEGTEGMDVQQPETELEVEE